MKNLLYIGNKLRQTNNTVTTIDTLSENFKREGYNVITASGKENKILRLLDMLCHIIKYRKKVDYVLIDTYSTINFYYASLSGKLCRFFKLKYIPILHGGNLPGRLKKSPKLSKSLFNKAHINIAPSLFIKTKFEAFGYKNITCIPNSIELKSYTFKNREFDKIKLLWVRSFSNIYNPILAIKIVEALKNENIDVELCMVGPEKDGSLVGAKALVKTLGLKVNFTGKLSKTDWVKLSENYNVFINTTNFDNMPVSVIEAMALGLPVISTNVGGIPFLIHDNIDGVLVKPNDVNEFVIAIKKIANSPQKTLMLTNKARKKVELFDWEIVKQKWFKVLS